MFSQIRKAIRQAHVLQRTGCSPSRAQEAAQSRRDFLKMSGLLALPVATGWTRALASGFPLEIGRPHMDPVLILGGGAAGLAAAYSLKKEGIPFKVLEASSRVGGRIFTQTGFNSDQMFVELGAEYIDTDHATLIELAREVGLEIQDMKEDDVSHIEWEMFYFNGVLRYHADLLAAAGPLAQAVHAAKTEIGPQFNYRNATAAGKKWDHISLAEFIQSLRGKTEDWFLDAVDVGYVLEMGRNSAEQSCLNLFWQVDDDISDGFDLFGPSDETLRVKGGNSALPQRLAELIGPDAIDFSTRVVAIENRGGNVIVTASQDGQTKEYRSDQMICALPVSMMHEIDLKKSNFSAAKIDCFNNLKYGQNSKLIMNFESRFWRAGTEKRRPSTGWLMSDLPSQNFWETSRAQKGSQGILTNFLGGTNGLNARQDALEKINLPDLEKVYPEAPRQYLNGVAMNWNFMPTVKGSYVCVGPGQYSRFFGAQSEPELRGQVLFAGEHTSVEFMGYMNGAYATGIEAANTIISRHKKLGEAVS
jgi:monoamine oxidase